MQINLYYCASINDINESKTQVEFWEIPRDAYNHATKEYAIIPFSY
jgi:hypothetical protein